jgi:two-component system nitrate/nitrite response regulator NarL
VLAEAGFTVFAEPRLHDDETIIIGDFNDYEDLEALNAHQQHGEKIVILTGEADSRRLSPDDIAPLRGILTYDLSVTAFAQSLRLIYSGERVFSPSLALGRRQQARLPGAEPRSDGDRLSPHEKEMLSHLLAGHSNKAIACHLGITEATVKAHLKSLQRKIRVENRTQAAIWALSNLPELDPCRGFV